MPQYIYKQRKDVRFLDHKTYTVYKAENMLNGKVYVGVTTKPVVQRWKCHVSSAKTNNLALGAAIRKYGEESFELSSLEECKTKNQMLEKEKFWIGELNSYANTGHGYNMTLGGDGLFGYRHTEEAKSAMSEKRRGQLNHNYGKQWGRTDHPDEFIEMMSVRHTGEGNPMYGKRHNSSARSKIAAARTKMAQRVIQLDLEGNKIMEYESAKAAAYAISSHAISIRKCCSGARGKHLGFRWQYATGGV